jgi:hypothetical protein
MTITESQIMALTMFSGQVPCAFSMIDECAKRATWVAIYEHIPPSECELSPPMPLCDEHKSWAVQSTSPFWLMWMGQSLTCNCGSEVKVGEWRPLT